ncbi:MAG: hypothetical protein JOZ15_13410 [Acidobacteria bacterium]|nr:hypothetical protein [Acidobacteriota bacterium]
MPRPQPPSGTPGARHAPDALDAPDVIRGRPGEDDAGVAGARHAPDAPDAISRWLVAERSGVDDAAAEAALAALLAELERPSPPAGFAERVLARARQTPRHGWLGRPGWRARPKGAAVRLPAFSATAAAAAMGAAAIVGVLLVLFGRPVASAVAAAMATRLGETSIAGLLQSGVDTAFATGQWVAAAVAFGDKLLLLVRAVAEPLATPPVAALAAGCLLVSVLAMRCLYDLIQRDRRWVYVDPI